MSRRHKDKISGQEKKGRDKEYKDIRKAAYIKVTSKGDYVHFI